MPKDDISHLRKDIYQESISKNFNELVSTIQTRTDRQLPMAIEAFNRIQRQKTPSWNASNNELGLEENPNVPRAKDVDVVPPSEESMKRKMRSLKSQDQIENVLNESDLPVKGGIQLSQNDIAKLR